MAAVGRSPGRQESRGRTNGGGPDAARGQLGTRKSAEPPWASALWPSAPAGEVRSIPASGGWRSALLGPRLPWWRCSRPRLRSTGRRYTQVPARTARAGGWAGGPESGAAASGRPCGADSAWHWRVQRWAVGAAGLTEG